MDKGKATLSPRTAVLILFFIIVIPFSPPFITQRRNWREAWTCGGMVLFIRFLQENLPGYREYAGRVRYRLLPGVW